MDGGQPQLDEQPQPGGQPVLIAEDAAVITDPGDAADGLDLATLPEPPQSGDQAVDQATAQLAQAMRDPLEAQLAAYDAAHRTLQDRLADVEN